MKTKDFRPVIIDESGTIRNRVAALKQLMPEYNTTGLMYIIVQKGLDMMEKYVAKKQKKEVANE